MNTPLHPTQSSASAEALSALMDGELDAAESANALRQLLDDEAAQQSWHAYQVIGDVLRDPALAPSVGELDFGRRLQAALINEPTPAAVLPQLPERRQLNPAQATAQSANSDVFRWKMVAGVASLGLGLVLAMGLPNGPDDGSAGRLASATPTVTAAGNAVANPGASALSANSAMGANIAGSVAAAGNPAQLDTATLAAAPTDNVMLRNPELDALLLAHQQMGGHSALQMPSGFLRNATFERAGR